MTHLRLSTLRTPLSITSGLTMNVAASIFLSTSIAFGALAYHASQGGNPQTLLAFLQTNPFYLAGSILCGCLGSFLGGAIVGLTSSQTHALRNTLIMSGLSVCIALYSLIQSFTAGPLPEPLWSSSLPLILEIPFALLGAWTFTRTPVPQKSTLRKNMRQIMGVTLAYFLLQIGAYWARTTQTLPPLHATFLSSIQSSFQTALQSDLIAFAIPLCLIAIAYFTVFFRSQSKPRSFWKILKFLSLSLLLSVLSFFLALSMAMSLFGA
jgi:hypothetical protein